MKHITALPSHYDSQANEYDSFNEAHSKPMNHAIEQILKKHDVKTVLDAACGTGAQALWLARRGYHVIGSDISDAMLTIARKKATEENLAIKLYQQDMRTVSLGSFDAVISMFNAVGHLTKDDFKKTMHTVHTNLTYNGIYIFDILDAKTLQDGNTITTLTIDWQEKHAEKTIRKIQYSTINDGGVLTSYTIYHNQTAGHDPNITNHAQTLQTYTELELKEMLSSVGFKILSCDKVKYHTAEVPRLFVVAKKK